MYSTLKETQIAIEFPKRGEVVTSPQYTLRIAAPVEAERVEVSINGGEFVGCRRTNGRWWFDWAGYKTGYNTVVVRARFRDGFVVTLPPYEIEVDLGDTQGQTRSTVTQYSVITPNEPGTLARLTQVLSREGVDLAGVATERFGDSAAIRFLTKQEDGLRRKLEQAGFPVLKSEAFHIELPNRPAELNKLARVLAEEGINIVNLYSTTHGGKARCVVTVDRPDVAARVMERHGIEMLDARA